MLLFISTSSGRTSILLELNLIAMKVFSYLINCLAIAVGLLFFCGAVVWIFNGGGVGAAILILLSLLLVMAAEARFQRSQLKVCSACAELVRPQALKCRFCGHIFASAARAASNSQM